MTSSTIRAAAMAIAVALGFAACVGHGVVPSTAGPNAGGDATASGAASPCLKPTLGYLFRGAFSTFTLTAKGGSGNVPAYEGFTLRSKFGGTNLKAKTVQVLYCAATGKGDISGKLDGHAFPHYTGAAGAVVYYIEIVNVSTTTVEFASTPSIAIAGTFPKGDKKCTLLLLEASGKWLATPLVAPIVGGKIAYPSAPNLLNFGLPPGSVFLGTACK